jgi:hypothetical protein
MSKETVIEAYKSIIIELTTALEASQSPEAFNPVLPDSAREPLVSMLKELLELLRKSVERFQGDDISIRKLRKLRKDCEEGSGLLGQIFPLNWNTNHVRPNGTNINKLTIKIDGKPTVFYRGFFRPLYEKMCGVTIDLDSYIDQIKMGGPLK